MSSTIEQDQDQDGKEERNLPSAIDRDQDEEIRAFLSGSSIQTVHKQAPIPQAQYKDRVSMLYAHNGYDVFTAEGLLKWQTYAIDKVAEVQPKLTTDSTFKGIPTMTAEQQRELQASREEGEETALSADVRLSPCYSIPFQRAILQLSLLSITPSSTISIKYPSPSSFRIVSPIPSDRSEANFLPFLAR